MVIESEIETDPSDHASQISFDSFEEQTDIDDINRILDTEMPDTIITVTKESYQLFKKRIHASLSQMLEYESRCLEGLAKQCLVNNIYIQEAPVNLAFFDYTVRNVLFITDSIKCRNRSFFEKCYDLKVDLAEHLLSEGYFLLSTFGRLCPVQYYENENPFLMYEVALTKYEIFPVLHRNFIYYIHGSEKLKEFKKNPLKYVDIEKIEFPIIPLTIAITGPPKCGKTTLAQNLGNKFGLKIISEGQAIRYVLSDLPYCTLARRMVRLLKKGLELTDELVIKCVEAAALDGDTSLQGTLIYRICINIFIINIYISTLQTVGINNSM